MEDNNVRRIYAIADIHLNNDLVQKCDEKFPEYKTNTERINDYKKYVKDMTFWGNEWENHQQILEKNWDSLVKPNDIVILAGDNSWTKNLKDGKLDMTWISQRPGIKIMGKGNHDYYFPESGPKIKQFESEFGIHILSAGHHYIDDDVIIVGTRLVDYDWNVWPFINPKTLVPEQLTVPFDEDKQKREIDRMNEELKVIKDNRSEKRMEIVVTHHPPFNENGEESVISKEIVECAPNYCIYGHIHTLPRLCELEEYKTVDDVIKRFHGVDCTIDKTHFELVSSDLRGHQLTLVTEIENPKDYSS